MRTKDFILLGAGYAAGRLSKKMQAGPIGSIYKAPKKQKIEAFESLKRQFQSKRPMSESEIKMMWELSGRLWQEGYRFWKVPTPKHRKKK